MVIQRIQTLFLILAIGLTVAFFFVPYGYVDLVDINNGGESARESLKAVQEIGFIIPMAFSLLCMVIAIFSFKNLSAQKFFVIFSALLTASVIIAVIYILVAGFTDMTAGVTVLKTYWGGGGLMMVAAFIAEIMAYRGISSDQRLLRSSNRFRD